MISFTTLKWAHQDQLVLIKSSTFIDEHFHIHWQTSESCEGTFSHFLANLKALDVGGAELEQVMDCTLRTILLCKCHSLRLNLCANYLQVVLEANQLRIHQFITFWKQAKPCTDIDTNLKVHILNRHVVITIRCYQVIRISLGIKSSSWRPFVPLDFVLCAFGTQALWPCSPIHLTNKRVRWVKTHQTPIKPPTNWWGDSTRIRVGKKYIQQGRLPMNIKHFRDQVNLSELPCKTLQWARTKKSTYVTIRLDFYLLSD